MQCHPWTFDAKKHGDDGAKQLQERMDNINILTVDVDFDAAEHLSANVHYVPFHTSAHYVPLRKGRRVAIDGSHIALTSVASGSMWAAQPPTPTSWQPMAMAQQKRPFLISYVGANGRKTGWQGLKNRRRRQGWSLKDMVRCCVPGACKCLR